METLPVSSSWACIQVCLFFFHKAAESRNIIFWLEVEKMSGRQQKVSKACAPAKEEHWNANSGVSVGSCLLSVDHCHCYGVRVNHVMNILTMRSVNQQLNVRLCISALSFTCETWSVPFTGDIYIRNHILVGFYGQLWVHCSNSSPPKCTEPLIVSQSHPGQWRRKYCPKRQSELIWQLTVWFHTQSKTSAQQTIYSLQPDHPSLTHHTTTLDSLQKLQQNYHCSHGRL